MKNLFATLFLTIAMLFGWCGAAWSADFDKGFSAFRNGDYAAALQDWTPLAEEGNADAQWGLGLMHDKGLVVPQDHKIAAQYYRLSAEQGYADAQLNLAVLYAVGEGVIEDYVYAHMWANHAASNGNDAGINLRDMLSKEMTPAQIAQAQKLARECVAKDFKGC